MTTKILMVTPYFYPRAGGVEKYSFEIASRLFELHGMDVSVVCCDWENRHREIVRSELYGMRVYTLPYSFKISSTPIGMQWMEALRTIVAKERPRIINAHTPVPFISDVAARVAFHAHIPFVLTYHNDLMSQSPVLRAAGNVFHLLMGSRTLSLSDVIVATSDYYVQSSRALREHQERVRIVPPGVDLERFQHTNGSFRQKMGMEGSKIVLFVGHIDRASRHKGLDYLIRAMRVVDQQADAKLVVGGEGDFIDHYRRLARVLGIGDKVVFTGYLDNETMSSCFHESDVVVLPSCSRAEGFGMVLLEAQACRKPVIGTNVGGIPAAIVDGSTGILVPPKDSAALAESIIATLNDEEMSSRMGQAGAARVRKQFTWERSAQKFYGIVQEAVN